VNKTFIEQALAALSGGSGMLYAVYLALFGGLGWIVVKAVRGKLGDWLRRWLEGVLYLPEGWIRVKLARQFTIKRYCRLRLGDDKIRLLPVPAANSEIKLDVDRAFVPLRLEHDSGEKKWLDHASLLAIGQRIRVIGDPGSGKSSLVKRLLRDACFAALQKPTEARFPVLLELRTLKLPPKESDRKKLGDWLWKEVRKEACRADAFKIEECVDAYAKGPGLLLLLDGLDEVASVDYPRMHLALLGLSQFLTDSSPNNGVVLTMRTQFYKQVKEDFRDDFGYAVTVQPFTPTDIYDFLSRWPFGGESAQIRERRNRIYKELTDRASLREMCSNPLVLAMYVAQDVGFEAGAPPESRTAFYKQVVEELLIKRRIKQIGANRVVDTVRTQREGILGQLTLEHMLDVNQPANSLSWARAIEVVQAEMQCDAQQAEAHFKDLAKETGLIVEVQPQESFRFIHLTFCEFFAALETSNGPPDGWARLLAQHREFQANGLPGASTRLAEVLPFACGLLPRGARPAALADLAACATPGVTARAFLESKLYNHACWVDLVTGWKAALLATPEQDWDEEWLKNLHLFNVVTDDARQHGKVLGGKVHVPDLDEFFKNLVDRQRDSLGKLLHAYAKLDAAAVLRLAEKNNLDLMHDYPQVVLQNCDQRPFFALMLDHAWQNPADAQAWATLFAEAALRSQAVADEMAAMPQAPEWQALAMTVPKQASWLNTRFIDKSLFTQCLTIACHPHVAGEQDLTLVQVLRRMPAPNACRLFLQGAWLPSLAIVCGFMVLICWVYGQEPDSLWLSRRIELSSWFALGFFSCWQVKGFHTAKMYQNTLCGLGKSTWNTLALRARVFSPQRERNGSIAWLDWPRNKMAIILLFFGLICMFVYFCGERTIIYRFANGNKWLHMIGDWHTNVIAIVLLFNSLSIKRILVRNSDLSVVKTNFFVASIASFILVLFSALFALTLLFWGWAEMVWLLYSTLFTIVFFVDFEMVLEFGAYLPTKTFFGRKSSQVLSEMQAARLNVGAGR
jgi:hypothetical protein